MRHGIRGEEESLLMGGGGLRAESQGKGKRIWAGSESVMCGPTIPLVNYRSPHTTFVGCMRLKVKFLVTKYALKGFCFFILWM